MPPIKLNSQQEQLMNPPPSAFAPRSNFALSSARGNADRQSLGGRYDFGNGNSAGARLSNSEYGGAELQSAFAKMQLAENLAIQAKYKASQGGMRQQVANLGLEYRF